VKTVNYCLIGLSLRSSTRCAEVGSCCIGGGGGGGCPPSATIVAVPRRKRLLLVRLSADARWGSRCRSRAIRSCLTLPTLLHCTHIAAASAVAAGAAAEREKLLLLLLLRDAAGIEFRCHIADSAVRLRTGNGFR
jgi:hypothetical protein